MFKKAERLSKREFDEVFRIGKRHHFPHLTVIIAPRESRSVSVVVGKKVSRLAVRRNTLRRRIYAILREVLTQYSFNQAMIVITKPSFNSLTRTAAEQLVRKSVEQLLETP